MLLFPERKTLISGYSIEDIGTESPSETSVTIYNTDTGIPGIEIFHFVAVKQKEKHFSERKERHLKLVPATQYIK